MTEEAGHNVKGTDIGDSWSLLYGHGDKFECVATIEINVFREGKHNIIFVCSCRHFYTVLNIV